MANPTKKFAKAVSRLTAELAEPTPYFAMLDKQLAKARKWLNEGAEPTPDQYRALRQAWEENQSLDTDSNEELKDIAFTVAKMLTRATLQILAAESSSLNPDDDILECNYFLLMDLTCDCGKDQDPDDEEFDTQWFVAPTVEEYELFFSPACTSQRTGSG